MEGKTRCRLVRPLAALTLSVSMLLPGVGGTAQAALQNNQLSISQAVGLAVSSSDELRAHNSKILLKKMKRVEAEKGIRTKLKDLRTFRWTPLFGFKFPKPLDIVNEFDADSKPEVLQSDVDKLVFQKEDVRRTVVEKVQTEFLTAYQLQTSVNYTEERLDDAITQMNRTEAKVALGTATEADAQLAKTKVETLEVELSGLRREQSQSLAKLSDLSGVDVTVGYELRDPCKIARIPREQLDGLIQYTLGHNQAFFEAKTNESVAYLTLTAYEKLMREHYGWRMNGIQHYINMYKQGMKVDSAAFQLAYNDMLRHMDEPWDGTFRILFFRFNKELLKGEIDGTRYIQDEMYAVQTSCMEYEAARKEREAMEKDLTGQVRDMFENIVTSYNAYVGLKAASDRNQKELDQLLLLNKQGKATFEETSDAQQAFQSSQQDVLDALCEYNQLIVQFDRLTCGAVSQYLSGESIDLDTGKGGDAYALLDPILEPYYYLYCTVADLTFSIGVSIPADFRPEIDSFEIWYEGTQIGERTMVGEVLTHLTLVYGSTNELQIQFFNDDEYVDECTISTAVHRDRLDIRSAEPAPDKPQVYGTYKQRNVLDEKLTTSELILEPDTLLGVESYSLSYNGNKLLTGEKVPIKEPFTYLTLLIPKLGDVEITFYKKDGTEITAYFDPASLQLLDTKPEKKTAT